MSTNFTPAISNRLNHESEINLAIESIDSSSVTEVIRGLNVLTKKSYSLLDNPSLTMHLESYPQLLISLGYLLDTINPMGKFIFENIKLDPHFHRILPDSYQPWYMNYDLNPLYKAEIKAYAYYLDGNQILLSILNIIRNLSFEVMNEYILSTNTIIVKHLVSILIMSMETNNIYQSTYLSIEIFLNIASKIDLLISNRIKKSSHFYMIENTLNIDEMNKNALKLRLHYSYSQESSEQYHLIISGLMIFITHVIVHNLFNDKFLTLKCLELLSKLAQNADNLNYISNAPMIFYNNICSLLCSNITFVEPLVSDIYHISGDPAGRGRLPASIVLASTDLINRNMNITSNTNNTIQPHQQLQQQDNAQGMMQPITFNGIPLQTILATSELNHYTRNNTIGINNINNNSGINMLKSNSSTDMTNISTTTSTIGGLGAMNIPNVPTTISSQSQDKSSSQTNKSIIASQQNSQQHQQQQQQSMIELSDVELRDQALDTLHTMCSSSNPSICIKLLSIPRILDILLRISTSITSLGGSNSSAFNKDSPIDFVPGTIKANQIIGFLLSQKEGIPLFLSKKADLMVAASSEDLLADIVCNKALPVQIAVNNAIIANQQLIYDTNITYNDEATSAIYTNT